ncbi:MAG: DUF393 domain-containing protein [Pseudomonadota bacterium]
MMRAEKDYTMVQASVDTCVGESANPISTVYFDGSCPLCTAEISHYASQRGSDDLKFVDVSKADAELGTDLSAKDAMSRFHVRLPDGQLISGARAFVVVWQTLPSWRWMARIARLPGIVSMLELAYRIFLPVRPTVSRFANFLGARPAKATARKK